jgi:hypothetical protein
MLKFTERGRKMKMEVKATVNGRRVRLEEVPHEMMRSVFADLARKARNVAAQVVCTSHGKTATLTAEHDKPLAYVIEGCCKELEDRVKRALESRVG